MEKKKKRGIGTCGKQGVAREGARKIRMKTKKGREKGEKKSRDSKAKHPSRKNKTKPAAGQRVTGNLHARGPG